MSSSSRYSLYGSAAFDARVDADMARIVDAIRKSPAGRQVQSIILLGGYGRGEGTPLQLDGAEVPFNDYDLVVITNTPSATFAQCMHQLEKELSTQLGIPVDLYPHSMTSLKQAERSLLNYEMQKGHQVIWGASHALALMPDIPLQDVPLSEGTRLLLNRGKLLLDIQCRLEESRPLAEEEAARLRKFLWKNHLAFGDCALLVLKEYDVLYQVKTRRLEQFRESKELPDASWMISAYLRAVEFKQRGRLELLPGPDIAVEWRRTRDYWLRFLLWFEGIRLGRCLDSVEVYSQDLADREPKEFKSLLRNAWYVGWRMVFPSLDWLFIHPRSRLYPALYLLLSEDFANPILPGLLGIKGLRKALRQRFYQLRARLS